MGFFEKIVEFILSTQVLQHFKEVYAAGLFTNPWFLVPAKLLLFLSALASGIFPAPNIWLRLL